MKTSNETPAADSGSAGGYTDQLVQQMDSGVAVYEAMDEGADFVFVDVNPAAERTDSIRREEVIGRRLTHVFPGVEEFGLLDVLRRVWKTGVGETLPATEYRDQRIRGWRENRVYRLPNGYLVAVYQDVTERVRTETALKASEERYQLLTESSLDGVWDWDFKRDTLYLSPRWKAQLGYADHELKNELATWTDLLHPDDKPRVMAHLESYLAAPNSNWNEYFRLRHKDGHYVPTLARGTPVLGERNELVRLFGVQIDTSRREQAEQRAQEGEIVLDSVFQSLPDLFFLLDFDGTIRDYRASRKQDLYEPPETFLGKRMQDVLPPPLAERFDEKIRVASARHGDPQILDYTLEVANGLRYFEARLSRLPDRSQLMVVVRDISARKEAEAMLKTANDQLLTIFENVDDVIYVADPESFELLYVNPAFTRSWGGNILGRKCYRVLQNRDAPCPFCSNPQIFGENLGRTYVWEFQNEVTNRWYRCSDKAIRWVDGRMVRFEHASDITEQKLAEEERANYRENLEKQVQMRTRDLETANKDLESFSYSVSHDLRAPLRAIDGFVSILQEDYADKLDEEGQRLFGIVSDNARKMSELIDDILSLSRAGRMELECLDVDMNALVDQVWAGLGKPGEGADPHFRRQELPPAHCDPRAIRQVWQNLLDNALKFTRHRESADIHVWAERSGDYLIYRVSDNGVGFDPRYTDKLFKLFQRLHRSDEFDGTGVGLAIISRLIQKHGGYMEAKGEVDTGATFGFSLPVRRETAGTD